MVTAVARINAPPCGPMDRASTATDSADRQRHATESRRQNATEFGNALLSVVSCKPLLDSACLARELGRRQPKRLLVVRRLYERRRKPHAVIRREQVSAIDVNRTSSLGRRCGQIVNGVGFECHHFSGSDRSFSDWLDPILFKDFIDHRSKLRKPMTDKAKSLFISKLTGFYEKGYNPKELIETAIERGWQTVFEPKMDKGNRVQDQNIKEAINFIMED